MVTEEHSNKKRRIRPSKATAGVSAGRSNQNSLESPKPEKPKEKNQVVKIISPIFRPIYWLLRHITPRYIRNSFAELRQVTWPGRKQSRQLTSAVVLFSIVFGFLVAVLDYGLDRVFKKVFLKE